MNIMMRITTSMSRLIEREHSKRKTIKKNKGMKPINLETKMTSYLVHRGTCNGIFDPAPLPERVQQESIHRPTSKSELKKVPSAYL